MSRFREASARLERPSLGRQRRIVSLRRPAVSRASIWRWRTIDRIVNRVLEPGIDRRRSPAGTAVTDLDLSRKGAVDLAIQRRATEPGLLQNGRQSKDRVGLVGYRRFPSVSFDESFMHLMDAAGRSQLALVKSDPLRCGEGASRAYHTNMLYFADAHRVGDDAVFMVC